MDRDQRCLSLAGWFLGVVGVAWSQQSWISDQLSTPDGSLLSLTFLPIFLYFAIDGMEEACDTLFFLFVNIFYEFSLAMMVVGFLLGGDDIWSHLLFLRESAVVPLFAWAASEVWSVATSADTPDGRYFAAFRQAVCVAERPMTVELCSAYVSSAPFVLILCCTVFAHGILGLLVNPFLRRSLDTPPDGRFQLPSSSMLTISFLQIFIYYGIPSDIQLTLDWNPLRRQQVWRFVTPALLHTSALLLWRNVIGQLLLTTLLQVFLPSRIVLLFYMCGIIGGSLATSVLSPKETFGVGASGGLTALLFATILTLILVDTLRHWPDASHRTFHPRNLLGPRLFSALNIFIIATILFFDVVAFFLLSDLKLHPPTHPRPQTERCKGIEAVFGGAVAGVLGALVLHMEGREGAWAEELRKTVRLAIFVLVSSAVGVNILFPRSYWEPQK